MDLKRIIVKLFCEDFISNQCDTFSFVSRVIDTAAQLTKTAITVTAIFIVALGYDLWYYILGHLGVTEYIYNSPKQKYGKLTQLLLKQMFILSKWPHAEL